MRNALQRALLAAALLVAPYFVAAQIPVPPLQARVTDLTNTLTADQRAALEAKLATVEVSKGSQVAVLIVPTTQPEAIEQYAVRVEETWKLGRKGVDDGVLLVVAKEDRKLRIEVGYGLEGALNDATARRIIEEDITPRFKQGDFYGGIRAGVERIIKIIDGEPLPAPKHPSKSSQSDDLMGILLYGFIAVFLFGGLLRAILGRFLGSGVIGVAAGVAMYMLVGAVAAVIVAIAAFLINLFGPRVTNPITGWSSGTSWSSGGGSWSSSGSSGGGFSGGGGSSGGGGASGSW